MTREGVLVEYTIRGGRTSLSTLKRWEATGNPNLDDLVLLADVYGLTVAQLIGDEPLPSAAKADDPFPEGMAAAALEAAEGISETPGGAARVPTLQDADDALRDEAAAWEREARPRTGGSPRRRPADRPRTDS